MNNTTKSTSRTKSLRTFFPLDDDATIVDAQTAMAGHHLVTMTDGTQYRADSLTPLGKQRTHDFEVHCLGVSRRGTPKGKLNVVQFDAIESIEKLELSDEQRAEIAAKIAARRAIKR
jgi:hypothetical protein